MTLKTADVRKLEKPGRYGDSMGLYLVVKPNGTKSWVQRITVEGQRLDRGLGGFPTVSLAAARRVTLANRAAVERGENPFDTGKRQTATKKREPLPDGIPTFREAVYAAWEVNQGRWRSDKYRRVFLQQMELHAIPVFGEYAITEITQRQIIDFLQPLRAVKPEAGRKMRQRLSRVFRWAMAREYIATNPAGEAIDDALESIPKQEVSHRALPYQEVACALRKVRDSRALPSTKLCFVFLTLTASRSNEARGARWAEIDWTAGTWTIPAHRSKDGKQHVKPLSIQAEMVLREAKARLNGGDIIFPANGKSDKPLSENALSLRARKDNIGCVPHGMRASFKTWATETGQDRVAVEFALCHNPYPGVEGVYQRSDWVEGQRVVLDAWANYLDPLPF